MDSSSRHKHVQFAGLDILRFLSALMVMCYHIGLWCFIEPDTSIGTSHGAFGKTLDNEALLPFASFGWIGVPIFFVISGFVISYTANGASVSGYIKSRLVRLLPAIWICASITASIDLFAGLHPENVVAAAYRSALLLDPFGPWIDGVYWTLPVEVSFYALVLLFLVSNGMNRIERVFTLLGLVSSTAWIFHYSLYHIEALYAFLGVDAPRLRISVEALLSSRLSELALLSYGCFFATGLILWAATRRGFTGARLAVLAFLSIGSLANIAAEAKLTETVSTPVLAPMAIYLCALLFIIVSVKFNQYFPRRYIREIGLATYPLYLLHNVVGAFLFGHILLPNIPLRAASYLSALACLLIVFLIIRPLERRLQNQFRIALAALWAAASQERVVTDHLARPTVAVD